MYQNDPMLCGSFVPDVMLQQLDPLLIQCIQFLTKPVWERQQLFSQQDLHDSSGTLKSKQLYYLYTLFFLHQQPVVGRVGEHQHRLAHIDVQYVKKTCTHMLDIIGMWEWGIWVGHLWLNGWGIYSLNRWGSHGKLLFRLKKKNAGLQGSTLSDHRMTTGFGPFEVPTCGLLQRGQDNTPLQYLLDDAVLCMGGSTELVKMLNRIGAIVSLDTHDRMATLVVTQRINKGILNELVFNTLTIASIDNIDILQRHAMVPSAQTKCSWHGTSVQCVQPTPTSVVRLELESCNAPPSEQDMHAPKNTPRADNFTHCNTISR